MSVAPTTIRVIIPLAIRKRNGRPKIMPPSNPVEANEAAVEAHVLRAIAKAWSWRRELEAGKASTNFDLAHAEDVSDRYIGRMIKLAYLAPAVLEKLLLQRCPLAVSVKDLTAIADLPWADQVAAAFGSSEA
jgi:CelD/BcsL family acetyltransferase involved in cellulose biosynthesis